MPSLLSGSKGKTFFIGVVSTIGFIIIINELGLIVSLGLILILWGNNVFIGRKIGDELK